VEAAQEDLWLLSALLKAIAATNKHATSQYDASVREIVEMYLRGGSPKSAGGSKSPSAAPGAMGAMGAMGAGGAAEMAKMMKSSMSRSGMDGGMGGVSGGRQIGIESVSFNPDDEFGEEVEEKDPKAASATVTAAPGAMGAMGPAGMMEAMAGGNRGGRNSSANMKRYVEEKTEWKTRGFYLEVIVDQRQVPQLLVELTNAEWPIRITRVHQADLNDETLVGGGSAGGMPGMPVGAGMGAGMGRGGASPEAAMRKMMGAGAMGGGRSAPSRRQSVDGEEAGGAARPMRSEMGGRSEGMSGLDDPMLVTLAVDGLFTIFNKPPEDKNPPAATNQQLPAMGADQQLPETPDAAATPTETEEPPAEATTAPAEATATETETEPVAEPAPAAGESAPEDQPTAPPAGDTPPTEEKAPPEPEN
jgi:hypothetical protein